MTTDIRTPKRKLVDFCVANFNYDRTSLQMHSAIMYMREDAATTLLAQLEALDPQSARALWDHTLTALLTRNGITQTESAAKKPAPRRPAMTALVVSIALARGQHATIVSGSAALITDIMECVCSSAADESLGDPPGPGMWIWEGDLVVLTAIDGDYDADYRGQYRPATDAEVQAIREGRLPEAFVDWNASDEDVDE